MIPFHFSHLKLTWISHACSLFVALKHFVFSHWLELSSWCPYYTRRNPCSTRKKLNMLDSFFFLFVLLRAATNVSSNSYAYSELRIITKFVVYQSEVMYFIPSRVYKLSTNTDRTLKPIAPNINFSIRNHDHFSKFARLPSSV